MWIQKNIVSKKNLCKKIVCVKKTFDSKYVQRISLLDLFHLDLTCPNLIWPVPNWLDLSWLDLTNPDFSWPFPLNSTCSKYPVQNGPTWPGLYWLTRPNSTCLDFTCPDLICPDLTTCRLSLSQLDRSHFDLSRMDLSRLDLSQTPSKNLSDTSQTPPRYCQDTHQTPSSQHPDTNSDTLQTLSRPFPTQIWHFFLTQHKVFWIWIIL